MTETSSSQEGRVSAAPPGGQQLSENETKVMSTETAFFLSNDTVEHGHCLWKVDFTNYQLHIVIGNTNTFQLCELHIDKKTIKKQTDGFFDDVEVLYIWIKKALTKENTNNIEMKSNSMLHLYVEAFRRSLTIQLKTIQQTQYSLLKSHFCFFQQQQQKHNQALQTQINRLQELLDEKVVNIPMKPGDERKVATLPLKPGEDKKVTTLLLKPGEDKKVTTLPLKPGEDKKTMSFPIKPEVD